MKITGSKGGCKAMLMIPLSDESKTPLYEQIYQIIKEKIKSGSLVCGEKLPSSRILSEQLMISRSTVNSAYEQLLSEGYIYSLEKSGYFVADVGLMLPASTSILQESTTNDHPLNLSVSNIAAKPTAVEQLSYSFSPFSLDMELFPHTIWRRFMNDAVNNLNPQTLMLGNPCGDSAFRTAIANYLSQSRGVNCSPDQIIVGAGTDYLLLLLCGLFSNERKIAMENPTYLRAYHIFRGQHYQVNPISVTIHGMDVSALKNSDSDIAYITPSHQYPLGSVMPVTVRSELLDWAYRVDGRYIIEDDHDSEFRYKGLPIPSLQGMDTANRVIYLGTFSRAIAPAIRISYMVLPRDLMILYQERFPYYSSTVSRVDQEILTRFINEGHLERHLNKMRKLYHQKHDAMLRSLKCFGDSITISGENAGLHLVVTFHGYGTEDKIQACANSVGLHLYSLKEHEIAPISSSSPTFLFGFAGMEETKMEQQINLLFHSLQSK